MNRSPKQEIMTAEEAEDLRRHELAVAKGNSALAELMHPYPKAVRSIIFRRWEMRKAQEIAELMHIQEGVVRAGLGLEEAKAEFIDFHKNLDTILETKKFRHVAELAKAKAEAAKHRLDEIRLDIERAELEARRAKADFDVARFGKMKEELSAKPEEKKQEHSEEERRIKAVALQEWADAQIDKIKQNKSLRSPERAARIQRILHMIEHDMEKLGYGPRG